MINRFLTWIGYKPRMETLILRRTDFTPQGVFGELLRGNKLLCYTGERPWLSNAHGVSCIPEGLYKCVPHSGRKFNNVWEITDVPGRSAILFHNGNVPVIDSDGCVLVGSSLGVIDGHKAVLGSMDALKKLRATLPKEFMVEIV